MKAGLDLNNVGALSYPLKQMEISIIRIFGTIRLIGALSGHIKSG